MNDRANSDPPPLEASQERATASLEGFSCVLFWSIPDPREERNYHGD
jgi:hypothetical protein